MRLDNGKPLTLLTLETPGGKFFGKTESEYTGRPLVSQTAMKWLL